MIKHSAVRFALIVAALASSAMAADFEKQVQAVDGFARRARELAGLQGVCALASDWTQTPLIKAANDGAPDFTLTDIAGQSVSLSSLTLSGKVVLLDFWATWCPPCRQSTPFLQELHEKYASQGLVVLGVNQAESLDTVKTYMNDKQLTYRVVLDSSRSTKTAYQVFGLPTFVVVGADGKILWRSTGLNKDKLKEAVEQALAAAKKAKTI